MLQLFETEVKFVAGYDETTEIFIRNMCVLKWGASKEQKINATELVSLSTLTTQLDHCFVVLFFNI